MFIEPKTFRKDLS